MNRTELLAPAGDLQRAKLALDFGADAIYFGAKQFSLRARASNFEWNDIKEISKYAHKLHKKIYLVVNIICHDIHRHNFLPFLHQLMKYKPHGLICSDPFIISTIKKHYPNVEIHISTQQSVTNSKSALFFARNGASRIIMARETTFNDLKQTIKNVHNKIDIEYFVHGALCIAYSGRCMLSNNFCLRDSNVGGCAQSCRWIYTLYDIHHIYSKKFSMSPKDLCLIKYLKQLSNIGLRSIKIEGRMKTEHYLITVVNAYRKTLDAVYKGRKFNNIMGDVNHAANRHTSIGWIKGLPSQKQMLYHDNQQLVNQNYAMQVVKKNGEFEYEVISKNYFKKNNQFKVLGKNISDIPTIKLQKIYSPKDNVELNIVNTPMTRLVITINKKLNINSGDILRMVI